MKKLLAGILVAVLVLCMGAASAEDISTAQKVCSDWFDYLYAMERACSNLMRAADTAEEFVKAPSWEKLQIAKMAIAGAERYVEGRGLDEPLMTADDYTELMMADIDVSFVADCGDQYGAEQWAIMDHLLVLREHMEADVFTDFELEITAGMIGHFQTIGEIQLEYLAISTDYLMATLKDEGMAEIMDEMVSAYLPAVDAYRTHKTDMEALKADVDVVLDQYDEVIEEFNKLLGISEATKDVYARAVETGDLSELISHAVVIENLPVMLPDTGWTINDGWDAIYYWLDAEGHVVLPGEEEELDRIPDGYMITCPGTAREDVLDYCNQLQLMGMDPLSSTEEDGVLRVYYTFMESTFVFEWENDTAKINMMENPLGFAPYWYLEAIYAE